MNARYSIAVVAALLIVSAGFAIRRFSTVADRASEQGATTKRSLDDKATAGTASSARHVAYTGPVWFHDVSDEVGIDFRHNSGTSPEKPFPAANGSGIAVIDFDLDGNRDLYFATGTPFPVDLTRDSPINRLYRNLGDWQFDEVTGASGLGFNGYSAGLAVGDFNSDGFPDIYIGCYGENCLYQNLGDGTFQRVEQEAGVADPGWATSAAFFDADNDGLVDIYVCNYGQWDLAHNDYCGDETKQIRTYCSPTTIKPVADVFFKNSGDGSFENDTATAGLAGRDSRTQGVVAADLNEDGAIDLYLGNDLHANSCFINDGNGTFLDESELSGLAYDYAGVMQAGMGVDVADYDDDGLFDVLVTNFRSEHNTLYKNFGKGIFQDMSHRTKLAAAGLAWVGWGTMIADFDLDGWSDIVVTNGHVDDNRHLLGQDEPYRQPSVVWKNQEGTFEDLGEVAGEFFCEKHVGRALVGSDLDNDGDIDLVIGQQDDRPGILRNERTAGGNPAAASVTVQLVGRRSNRDAIGSLVIFREGERVKQEQVKGGGSYLSAYDRRIVFAVKSAGSAPTIKIHWPSGIDSLSLDVTPGTHYIVVEPTTANTETILKSLDHKS